jgi:hypothetical protein
MRQGLELKNKKENSCKKAIYWIDSFKVSAEDSNRLLYPDMTICDYVIMVERIPLPILPDLGPSYTSKKG